MMIDMMRAPTTGTHLYLAWMETGFGADPETRARFAITEWHDFSRDIRVARKEMTGTARTKRQTTHIGPLRVQWDILTTYDHYRALAASQGLSDTLILPYGVTVHYDAGSEFETPDLQMYVAVSNVTLVTVSSDFGDAEGRRRATVEFEQVAT